MVSPSITDQHKLAAILDRAKEALQEGSEFSAAIPHHLDLGKEDRAIANLGIILERGHQLYVTEKIPVVVDGRTVERQSYQWIPTPPNMLGSLVATNLLYIHGKERAEGWPAADIALQARDTYIDRPGLIVGIGRTSLPNLLFVHTSDPAWKTWDQFDVGKFLAQHPVDTLRIMDESATSVSSELAARAARRADHAKVKPG